MWRKAFKYNLKIGHLNHFNLEYFWVIFKANAIIMRYFKVNNILKLVAEGNQNCYYIKT